MTDEFLPLQRAAAELGVSRLSLSRRVSAGKLPAYRNPLDNREVLIRVDDLERFRVPQPIEIQPRDARDQELVAG